MASGVGGGVGGGGGDGGTASQWLPAMPAISR